MVFINAFLHVVVTLLMNWLYAPANIKAVKLSTLRVFIKLEKEFGVVLEKSYQFPFLYIIYCHCEHFTHFIENKNYV